MVMLEVNVPYRRRDTPTSTDIRMAEVAMTIFRSLAHEFELKGMRKKNKRRRLEENCLI